TVKHKSLVLTEHVFEIRAVGIDPEFDHPARRVKTAGNVPCLFAFAGVADVDDDHLGVIQHGDQIGGFDFPNPGAGGGNHIGGGGFQFLHSWSFRFTLAAFSVIGAGQIE